MQAALNTRGSEETALCPRCGYDLRGHPDPTTCPECGSHVQVSAARAEAVRWVDMRLLDLWSIALLQGVGTISAVVALAAMRAGQYVALILGLVALVYTVCASAWLVACVVATARRTGRPAMRMVSAAHRFRLRRWLVIDAAIVAGSLACITLVAAFSFVPGF